MALSRIMARMVSFVQAGIGAVIRTVQDRMRETVSVKDFGAKGDGVADDTAAVLAALAAVAAMGKRAALRFPAGRYILKQPIPLSDGLALLGECPTDEFGFNTELVNATTDMLSYTGNVTGVKLWGISFRGNETNCSTKFVNDPGSGKSIRWSKIYDCGFNYFNKTTVTLTGVVWSRCYFNNAMFGGFEFKGSDNIVTENFMGSTNTAPSSYSAVYLNVFSNSRFERNYITGWKTIPMTVTQCKELVIGGNWIDESDLSGIYVVACDLLTITQNRFKTLLKVPAGVHVAALTVYDSTNLVVRDNTFSAVPSNLYLMNFSTANGSTNTILTSGNRSDAGSSTKYLIGSAVTGITIEDPFIPKTVLMNGTTAPAASDAIRGQTYYNATGATVNSFLLLPNAAPGMTVTAIRGSATYAVRLDPKAGESFRGLAAGVSKTLGASGSSISLRCVEVGIWDVVGSNGTIT